MPPKEKKGKGDPKLVKATDEKPASSEWDELDSSSLKEIVENLEKQKWKCCEERNFAQKEHDAVQSYCEVTRKNIQDFELQFEAKEHEREEIEIDNAAELQVYTQKEKHLIFQCKERLRMCEEKRVLILLKQRDIHERNILDRGKTKRNIEDELDERGNVCTKKRTLIRKQYNDEVQSSHIKLCSMVKEFKNKLSGNEEVMLEDLHNKRRIETQSLEKRKNLHLSLLGERHKESLRETREYYDSIVMESSRAIRKCKDEGRNMEKLASKHNDDIHNLIEENKRLSGPLHERLTNVSLV